MAIHVMDILSDHAAPANQEVGSPDDTLARAMAERDKYAAAIRKHRDYRGDDRCHLDDAELYSALPEGDTRPAEEVAVTPENCLNFIACRQQGRTYVSPQRKIEQLEKDLAFTKEMVRTLGDRVGGQSNLLSELANKQPDRKNLVSFLCDVMEVIKERETLKDARIVELETGLDAAWDTIEAKSKPEPPTEPKPLTMRKEKINTGPLSEIPLMRRHLAVCYACGVDVPWQDTHACGGLYYCPKCYEGLLKKA